MKNRLLITTIFFIFTFLLMSHFNISYALDCNLGGDTQFILGRIIEVPSPMQIICPFLRVFQWLMLAAGAIFLIMIVVGAIKMVTALGDPKGLASSRDTWVYAILGVFIVLGVLAILVILDTTFGLGIGSFLGPGGTNLIFQRISDVIENLLSNVFQIYEP